MRDTDSQPRAVPTYADRPVTKAPNWHGLVTLDILFNNLTTGLFLTAGMAELLAPETFAVVVRPAYPLALVLLLADLVCLVLDLGDPKRFHHMLRVWKPSSPMSLGTWALTAYSLPLTLLSAMSLFPSLAMEVEWLRIPVLVVGLVPAFAAALYKGVLFSTSSQPGWRDARWMAGYFVNSALLLGVAQLLVLAEIVGQPRAVTVLRPSMALLLVLNLIVLLLLWYDLKAALSRVRSRRKLVALGAITILGGLLLPLILLVIGGQVSMIAPGIFTLLGAAAVRSEIVLLPHG